MGAAYSHEKGGNGRVAGLGAGFEGRSRRHDGPFRPIAGLLDCDIGELPVPRLNRCMNYARHVGPGLTVLLAIADEVIE
jgi:hypothetical protein